MAKKQDLISDIILRLTKGNPSDDVPISEAQVELWLDTVRGELINSLLKMGEINFQSFIIEKNGLEIKKDASLRNPYYVEIPSPMSLDNDAGVYYVETESGDEIHPTPYFMKSSVKDLRFFRLGRKRSVYSRVGTRLYLMGNSINFYENGKVNVVLIPENSSDVDSEETYPVDAKVMKTLLEEVEKIGLRMLYGTIEDTQNDGEQPAEKSTPKTLSN